MSFSFMRLIWYQCWQFVGVRKSEIWKLLLHYLLKIQAVRQWHYKEQITAFQCVMPSNLIQCLKNLYWSIYETRTRLYNFNSFLSAYHDVLYSAECRHNLTYHRCSQFQFRFLFLPHAVSKRDAKIVDCVFVPQWNTEHHTYKAVPIEIVWAIMCSMVKEFWNILKCPAKLWEEQA